MSGILAALQRQAVSCSNRLAFSFLEDGEREGDRLTFAELDLRARAIGAFLAGAGLAGERVLLLYPPGPRVHRRIPGMPLRRSCRRSRLSATIHPHPASPVGDRPRRPPTGGAHRLGSRASNPGVRRALPRASRRPGDRVGWARSGAGRGVERSAARRRRSRVPPVHLGLDRRSQGGDGHPWWPARQRGDDPARLRPVRRIGHRRLAAPLPRHGADRERPPAAVHRCLVSPDVARRLPQAAPLLAAGDLALSGDDLGRSQLRV